MSVGKFANDVNRYFSRSSSERKSEPNGEFYCGICKKEFVDPRVLPCLHCFCGECLQKIESEQNLKAPSVKRLPNERFQGILASYFSKENSTKGEYVRIRTSAEDKDSGKYVVFHQEALTSNRTSLNRLKCPICNFENVLPLKGVQDLPPHYLLQHRMLLDSLNKGKINLLCDLCASETPATSRCTRCLLNLCNNCAKSHKREKLFPDHELKKLKKNKQDGSTGITRIRRQVMCPSHREKELKYYCSSCSMVACTECCVRFHSDHKYECFSKAAQIYSTRIKESLDKTRALNKDTTAAIDRLNSLSQQIESKYSQVQREINNHIDSYLEAFEKHRKSLLKKASQIKCEQIETVKTRRREVERKAQDIGHTLKFAEEVLNEGSDFEVLSFAFFLLQRLDWCIKTGSSALSSAFTSCFGTLQFLPEERAGTVMDKAVYGVVTAQIVSPSHCHITPEALDALKNCREKQRCDLILVTKDSYDQRLTHGAEGIEVSLKCQNSPNRHIPICIVDQQNGVYLISFTPDISGKMSLSVSIRGVPIKGSPFMVCVRPQRAHKGTFHCCSFCSSGGNKNAICGCGGRMPGGYQGCGHGFIGHPGGRHWSCCGNTLQGSECLRTFQDVGFYQLSL